MKRRRVKITGLGFVTPAGIGKEEFWSGILEPVSRVTAKKNYPEEAGPFRRRWARVPSEAAATCGRHLVTGMGARNAERGFREALDVGPHPDWVITAGFAGGLDPAWRPGDVGFDADPGHPLAGRLVRAGARPWRFHCADRVATTVAEKSALRAATGADAVEMESGVIRRLAAARGIPSATVRVISDAADAPLPLDFNALMTPDMRLSLPRLLGRLVVGPGKIPELIRFGRQTSRAAGRLAEVLVGALA